MSKPFLISSVVVFALTSAGISVAEKTVSHTTPYLVEGLEGAHRVGLVGTVDEKGGEGVVSMDPNTCGLNEFGDPTFCTLIGVIGKKVRFEPIDAKDVTKRGRRLYQITGLGSKSVMYLVVPATEVDPFRLVVKQDDKIARVVNLEPIQRPGNGK